MVAKRLITQLVDTYFQQRYLQFKYLHPKQLNLLNKKKSLNSDCVGFLFIHNFLEKILKSLHIFFL